VASAAARVVRVVAAKAVAVSAVEATASYFTKQSLKVGLSSPPFSFSMPAIRVFALATFALGH